jgi:hypothetical protein
MILATMSTNGEGAIAMSGAEPELGELL